ncbi:hypothetical protein K438DRAFT_922970 [Mycena galopus ATCC 62051]|nr:hypothetical protein K438DRAFT_922970 [Mycena galopus ATCC 62051]
MPTIRWLLAVLRKLILDNTLVRASIRGLLFLFSALWRATKKSPPPAPILPDDSRTVHVVYPEAAEHDGRNNLCPTHAESRVVYTSASFIPTSLHPYSNSGPSASRSSQDITAQESYSLHSLSVQHLPATLSVQNPPAATLSVQHLPTSPPSPNLGPSGYLPPTNSSVVDINLSLIESPTQSRPSSVHGGIAVASGACLNEADPYIFPATPETFSRYTRRTIIPDEPSIIDLPPLTIDVLPNRPPPGWTTCQHPEGALYFFHEEKRVFTDANLFDPEALEFITKNMDTVFDFLRANNVELEAGTDLVLDEYTYDDESKGCQYYFVNHQGRCVFWMDNGGSDLFPIVQELTGIKSASLIRHELEAQYWLHCEYYPLSFKVTHEIVDELRDVVLHAFGDVVTSKTSTVSWKVEDLKNMITLIDGFSTNVGKHAHKKFSGSNCLVGRLMHTFARTRVYNFHGEPGARLNSDQSIHATMQKRTMLVKILGPLFYYAPDFHLLALHTMYTDGLVRHRGWAEFVTRLNDEWQEFTLYATVMLNANVAFLSIQSVDQGGNLVAARSPAQISSYLSMLMSIGSIIIGLLLVKHHRNRDRNTASEAAEFIANRTHPTLGFETLAVLYSLPNGLLIWSMVSFLVAFSFMCFQKSNLLTRTLVGVVWTVVAVLILWCVFNSWEQSDWAGLRSLGSCFRCPADQEDESAAPQQDETNSAVMSESKPKKRLWAGLWSKAIWKRSYDSERTATNV